MIKDNVVQFQNTKEAHFNFDGGGYVLINSGDRPLTMKSAVFFLEVVKNKLMEFCFVDMEGDAS